MSKSSLIDFIETNFEKDGRICYYNKKETLPEAIENFLLNSYDCNQYLIDNQIIFENASYSIGTVAASWVTSDGKLESICYKWEKV
jgi:hypothetical protein